MLKRMALLLAAMLLIGSAMAEESENDWYLDISMQLAQDVGELAGDEAYIALVLPSLLGDEGTSALGQADYTTLESAYRLTLPDVAELAELAGLPEGEHLSEMGLWMLETVTPESILFNYIGYMDVDYLSRAAMLSVMRTYTMPEGFEPCVYILEFDHASIGVAFSQTGENTVSAAAKPLSGDGSENSEGAIQEIQEKFHVILNRIQ